ncbi:MAG: hypothetical protein WEA11_00595 [Acidimicrobiales bacterium]
MAIAVLVIVIGLIVGVTIELLLSKRRSVPLAKGDAAISDTLRPNRAEHSAPRFVDDGEGFRIIGPVDYDNGEAEVQEPSEMETKPENDDGFPSSAH